MSDKPNMNSAPSDAPRLRAGIFELSGISGVSLAAGADVLGIRMVGIDPSIGMLDGKDLPLSLADPLVGAPDLSYCRCEWRVPITPAGIHRYASKPRRQINAPTVVSYAPGEAAVLRIEWQFVGGTVRGRYSSDLPVRLALISNGCFCPAEVLRADPVGAELQLGAQRLFLALDGKVEPPLVLGDYRELERAWCGQPFAKGTKFVAHPVSISPGQPLDFTLSFLEAVTPAGHYPAIKAAEKLYEATRMRSTGDFADAAEAVSSLTAYSRAYDPVRQSLQTTVNRTWGGINRPGLIFGWDNFFMAYTAAWEDPALAAEVLEHILGVYTENGIDRGPTQRNLIIPLLYVRTLAVIGDEALARRTWPLMLQFMRFFFPHRDGNGDGLIEQGASFHHANLAPGEIIQEAMDESGYDDFPIYSAGFGEGRRALLAPGVGFDWNSRCLTVTNVCQNSLYIAACRALAGLGSKVGTHEEVAWLEAEAARVADRMRERLFCDEQGMFVDRLWSGEFSSAKTLTRFFPLFAGLNDDSGKHVLHDLLTDPKEFWGENMMPTVSRSDPSYCDGLDGRGNYWRGNCWPPTTYMVYLAARQAGWKETVAEYARRAAGQFMEYWRAHTHSYENYPPDGKVDHSFLYLSPWGGREAHFVWSGVQLFCGLEEIFGLELDGRLHFGNPFLRSASRWTGFTFRGRRVNAEAGPARTVVNVEGAWEFESEPGISVQEFQESPAGIQFVTATDLPATIRFSSVLPLHHISVNGVPVEAAAASGAFHVPSGISRVEISSKPARRP